MPAGELDPDQIHTPGIFVKRIVKVLGMVNSADGFSDQPKVVNGFSDLMVEVFGETVGKHARSAVGMAELPFDICVEIELEAELA